MCQAIISIRRLRSLSFKKCAFWLRRHHPSNGTLGALRTKEENLRLAAHPTIPPSIVLLLTVGVVLALILTWLGRVILLLLFATIVVAVFLTAIVDWIAPNLQVKRGLALAFILLFAAVVAVLTLWISGPSIIEQFARLQTDLP